MAKFLPKARGRIQTIWKIYRFLEWLDDIWRTLKKIWTKIKNFLDSCERSRKRVSILVLLIGFVAVIYFWSSEPMDKEQSLGEEPPLVQMVKKEEDSEPVVEEEPPLMEEPLLMAMAEKEEDSEPVVAAAPPLMEEPLLVEMAEKEADSEPAIDKKQSLVQTVSDIRGQELEMKERNLLVKKFPAGTTLRDCDTCPELVVVPPGSFTMGSPASEEGYTDEGPLHRVTIDRPFAVGKYEVTREEYAQFVLDTEHSPTPSCRIYEDEGEWNERSGHNWQNPGYHQTERDPVVCVTWEDAQEYVLWLSKKTGKAYRLLSEAEWEYVARAGTTTRYTWGDEIGQNRAHCDGCGSRWDSKRTSPVGSFVPNGFGLHDVHGNVWEWVADCWNRSYEGAPTDGSARESVACKLRVVRGGSWNSSPALLRSAERFGMPSDSRYSIDGFRVACTLTL